MSFNPLKHIDPFGTILLPAQLLLMRSPFLFGFAKPVPVNFQALHNVRRDSILVAAAGPAMNFVLALAALALHLQEWIVRSSRLDWTIVRPGLLKDSPATGSYRVLTAPRDWRFGAISLADVADFLVRQVDDRTLIGTTPLLIS